MTMLFRMALVIVVLSGEAMAQAATDNELYAGYCIGVLKMLRQDSPVVQQTTRRFSTYLLSTGAVANPARSQATIGVGMAMDRGRADQNQCTAITSNCSDTWFGRQGTPLPKATRVPQFQAYVNQNPVCIRAIRCMEPEGLPF